jgi:TonB-linked SusC/RagA family outer membrane protein
MTIVRTLKLLLVVSILWPIGSAAANETLPLQSVAFSQSTLLGKPARLLIERVELEEALAALGESASVAIIFSPSMVPRDRPTSCFCQNTTVEEALVRMLDGTGAEYFEMPLQIVIAPESQRPINESIPSPPVRLVSTTAPSRPELRVAVRRQGIVAGVVVNATTLQPLAGALVSVQGAESGTISDASGRFRLTDIEGSTVTLRVQLLGYSPLVRTVAVGAEDVQLAIEETAIQLEGVVVGALGIDRSARALGYAVAQVQSEDMTVNRTPNFMNALQGKIAGVNITSLGSGPQGSSKVRIRGQSSFGSNNSPLIVINGVPIDNTSFGVVGDFAERGSNRMSDSGDGLSSINPDDIEQMTVLKGAAAAALYGSRAKDGVIMITTRNRAAGTGVQWEFSSNTTVETPMDFRDYQMEYGQGEAGCRPMTNPRPEGTPESGGRACSPVQDSGQWSFGERFRPGMTQELFGIELPYQAQPNQLQEFYRTGTNITNALTVSQGGENGGVSASISSLRSQAIYPGSEFERYTVNLGFTQQVAERYNISGNVSYANEDRQNPPNIAEQDYSPVIIYNMANSLPLDFLRENAFTEEGNERSWSRFTNRTNPYVALTRFENNVRDRFYGNLTGRVEFTPNAYAQVRVGQDYYSRNQDYNLPTGTQRQPPAPPGFVNGQYVQDQLTFRELNADVLVGASGSFDPFGFSLTAGGNVMHRKTERSNVLVQDFYTRGVYTLANGRLLSPDFSLSQRRVNSVYGSAEVSFRDLIFLNGTLRNDWFSTLSAGNRSILYPSISASFMLSDAVRLPEWVTYTKLRAAYAEVGSDTDVPPYANTLFYSIDPNLIENRSVGSISGNTIPNPDLRPMSLSEWEVGVEAQLFDNIAMEFGFYQRTSRDQILNQQISRSSGFTTRRVNVGESRNRGVEALIDATLITRDRFRWNTTFNASYNKSKVIDLGSELGVDQITVGTAEFHGELRQVVGMPLNQLFGFGWLRDEQGRIIHNASSGVPVPSPEQLNFGSALPVWTGGITNSFSFGNLSMNFLVDFALGHKMISGTHTNAYRHGLDPATLEGREQGCIVGDGVKPDGTPNDICTPVQTYYESIRSFRTSEQSVFNAGSWQLRQISLGYDLTRFLPASAPVDRVRVNAVANNVAVLKKWVPHIHPDQNGIFSDARMGLEATGLPVTRGIGVNVNITF